MNSDSSGSSSSRSGSRSSNGASSSQSSQQQQPALQVATYQEGARLSTVVLKSFLEGVESRQTLHWRILKAFTPFSRSCVVLAELEHDDPDSSGIRSAAALPKRVIIKVYDRRYQAERLDEAEEIWTWETERHARHLWIAKQEEGEKEVSSREGQDEAASDTEDNEDDEGDRGEKLKEDEVYERENDYQESSRVSRYTLKSAESESMLMMSVVADRSITTNGSSRPTHC